MATIEELERRVIALETAQRQTTETQEWMASTLGRIAAVQDRHSKAIAELQSDVREVKADVRAVKADLKGLRNDLPAIVAGAVREVLSER
jgi:seryl-tRNA synthetase